jgi:hypothetical protein
VGNLKEARLHYLESLKYSPNDKGIRDQVLNKIIILLSFLLILVGKGYYSS